MSPRLAQLVEQMPEMRKNLIENEAAIQELYGLFSKEWRRLSDELQTEIEDLHSDYKAEREALDDEEEKQAYIARLGYEEAQADAYRQFRRDGGYR